MTSWNGNIFRVTGHLCGEFTGLRWIPSTKASDEKHIFFDLRLNKQLSKQSWGDLRHYCAHYDVSVMLVYNNVWVRPKCWISKYIEYMILNADELTFI